MENIGERLVGDYLNIVLGCDFVTYNLYTPDVQGEMDVVGINTHSRHLYLCEVVTHLVTGMMYVDPVTRRPDNVGRLVKKFAKCAAYARSHFPTPDWQHHFMLWSPVVRSAGPQAQHNQMQDIEAIRSQLMADPGLELTVICNADYLARVNELRAYAGRETKELKSPVLRLFQIEEKLKRHLARQG